MKHAKEAKQVSLTEGPILKSLLNLAFPIMISSFLGTLYNIVDMAWVGLLGANAVAGVGAGGMYVWLSSGFSTMTRMGGQVFAAQELGKGRREEARQYAKAAVQLVILMGVLYGVVCLAFTDQLIGFFQLSDAESVAIGIQYTKITCGLILFSFLNFTLTGLYTAQGDSRTPFVANFAGNGGKHCPGSAVYLWGRSHTGDAGSRSGGGNGLFPDHCDHGSGGVYLKEPKGCR